MAAFWSAATLALLCAARAARPTQPPLGASDAAQRVRASIASAFARYRAEAWGADVLAPLSQSGRDRYASGTLSVTLVASLDALWAARLDDDLEAAAAWVAAESARPGGFGSYDADVGEASGRVLGGLLSAFAATGDVRLLRAARQLGDRLLPAWGVRRRRAVGRLWSAKLGVAAPPGDLGVGTTLDAVAGLAELRELARGRLRGDALASDRVSVTAGSFLAANLTSWPGPGPEELAAVAAAGPPGDAATARAEAAWLRAADAYAAHLVQSVDGALFLGDLVANETLTTDFDGRSCAFPGLLARTPRRWPVSRPLADALIETCPRGPRRRPRAAATAKSLFFLRRATGDAAYAARAWDLFAHFEKGAATRGAFAALGDAEADPAAESPRRLVDDMPPSVIAETLKFLYLTFLENETGATHWPAGDAFAVTPRGHALPVASGLSLPPTDDDAAGAALRVGRVGTLTIPDDVDAADAIETFAAAARDAGHDVFRAKEMARAYALVAPGRAPGRPLAEPVTVEGVLEENVTIHAFMDPADALQRASEMLAWYCRRRKCHRQRLHDDLYADVALRRGNVTARVESSYAEPPEVAALRFLEHLRTEGFDDDEAAAAANVALDDLCASRPGACGRGHEKLLSLDVWSAFNDTVGACECPPLWEPAACVEKFLRRSARVGYNASRRDMDRSIDSMMAWFCARRDCGRPVAPAVRLALPDGRGVTVDPWAEPHNEIKRLALSASDAGAPPTERDLAELTLSVCEKRPGWCGALPATVGVEVRGVGSATCRPWEDPAEVVESFASQAVAAGLPVTASHLAESLRMICGARPCGRTKLKVTALRLFMHPGKTAGRAIAAALDAVDDIYQGGEARMERLLGNRCHHYLLGKRIGEILDDVPGLNGHCEFFDATASNATHCVFRPLTWWVDGHEANIDFLCYDSLGDEFGDILRPYCGDGHCPELPRKNPSDHSKVLGPDGDRHLPALRRFVESYYADDVALYRRHCPRSRAAAANASAVADDDRGGLAVGAVDAALGLAASISARS
ncbi:mannosyl-oligosaccharide 1,2-alpha-mannosidase [Aureococcus anophagefferens]|nr:mannosyl-oligosaccharide 1,2-alpha-mannosidase [Aureococcus anophagefferens]